MYYICIYFTGERGVPGMVSMGRSENNTQESVPSYHTGPGDWTQDTMFGSKHLYWLSHVMDLKKKCNETTPTFPLGYDIDYSFYGKFVCGQGLALWPQPNTNYVAGLEQSSYISVLGAETPGVSHHPHTSQVLKKKHIY